MKDYGRFFLDTLKGITIIQQPPNEPDTVDDTQGDKKG